MEIVDVALWHSELYEELAWVDKANDALASLHLLVVLHIFPLDETIERGA
ncbi:hypothetical protein EVA_08730 [gut metagenome]|uniref:Uncharacterized protein n=1 Tax=gut metagenome TaxID=749906 RepID=J9GLU4_9ZZZZ